MCCIKTACYRPKTRLWSATGPILTSVNPGLYARTVRGLYMSFLGHSQRQNDRPPEPLPAWREVCHSTRGSLQVGHIGGHGLALGTRLLSAYLNSPTR
jgi:hypothetical protein